jgi:hypothetical protein
LGRRTPLPVLPLFSASHLGMFLLSEKSKRCTCSCRNVC